MCLRACEELYELKSSFRYLAEYPDHVEAITKDAVLAGFREFGVRYNGTRWNASHPSLDPRASKGAIMHSVVSWIVEEVRIWRLGKRV